jgi:hypothetical protein
VGILIVLVVIFLFNIFLSEIPVGDARLRELALQLYMYMETASILQGVRMPANFAFSNGWLSNFKHSNKIKAYVGHGGEGSVDMVLNGPKFRGHRKPLVRLSPIQYIQL